MEGYSPTALARRAFAFDGSVRAIHELAASARNPDGLYQNVTFDVHDWYAPRTDQRLPRRVVVQMISPQTRSAVDGPSYSIGTRLLVSGEPRWDGQALDNPVAWTCGFTRTYDNATASVWQQVFGAP